MPVITIDDLVDRARLESGLRSNAYYNADQILRYLNAGGAELHDLFVTTNQKYVISEFDFTTTGPNDAIVTLPDDFQQGHSLDVNPQYFDGVYQGGNQTRTVRYLSNWLDRNSVGGNFSFSGRREPVYTFLDNKLRFYPPQSVPAANFKLYYTPTWTELLPEQSATYNIGDSATIPSHSRPVTIAEGDNVVAATKTWVFANGDFGADDVGQTFQISSGLVAGTVTIETVISPTTVTSFEDPAVTGSFDPDSDSLSVDDSFQFAFPNAEFTEDMEGGELVVAFTNPSDSGLNGTYTIYDVISPTLVVIRIFGPTLDTHNPTAGTITVNWQPPGTRATLPNVMTPWSEYLVVYAAMAINTDRQRPIGELERKLQALKVRVLSVLGERQEEPQQPPLTRGGNGWLGGWGW